MQCALCDVHHRVEYNYFFINDQMVVNINQPDRDSIQIHKITLEKSAKNHKV